MRQQRLIGPAIGQDLGTIPSVFFDQWPASAPASGAITGSGSSLNRCNSWRRSNDGAGHVFGPLDVAARFEAERYRCVGPRQAKATKVPTWRAQHQARR